MALARGIFEKVLALRPDEPQSFRDLVSQLVKSISLPSASAAY